MADQDGGREHVVATWPPRGFNKNAQKNGFWAKKHVSEAGESFALLSCGCVVRKTDENRPGFANSES